MPQRGEWIDAERAPRRDIASDQCDTHEESRDTGERRRICRPHTIKKSRHQARCDGRCSQASDGAANGEANSLTENQSQDGVPVGAGSHIDKEKQKR